MDGLRTGNGNRTHPLLVAQSRPRAPGVAFAAFTLVLAVLVGTLALTSRQTQPPTIAEFAPQAVEQISESSGDVAASRGSASGETSALDEQAERNEGTELTIDVARVRRCVGDPPRQIEDPQSPPCVPYWTGNNGGSTSRGVTRDEIRVSDPGGIDPALVAFFNRRFEFYGRQIHLRPRSVAGDAAAERTAARAAYDEDHAFASTAWGPHFDYFDELARLGIVGMHFAPVFPETYLTKRQPYLWTYPMASDRMFAMVGNWYCARFAGRNAIHAGDPFLQLSRRKPGVILTGWGDTSVEPMNAQLASCGDRTDAVIVGSFYGADPIFFENAILQMKTWGVTTLTCLCNVSYVGYGMAAASNQGYFPEWLLTDFVSNDAMSLVRLFQTREQMKSLMLLLSHPMERPYADHPANWATQEVGKGGYPTTSLNQLVYDQWYWMLLLLASGIQMAGPRLTPQTFERGLHLARFPNPAHRIMPGTVGFGDGDHTMTDDAVEVWWSNTAQSPYPDDGVGTYCYVDHGARRRMGTFPTDDPFFQGPCDNGTT